MTTITLDSLPSFLIDLSQRLVSQKEITIDYINTQDLYTNSKEYIQGRQLQSYDMNNSHEKHQFFIDLKA
jgi:hypothetical protein